MIDLEERLGSVLDTAADGIAPTPQLPGLPQAMARRRRRNRRLTRIAMFLLLAAGVGTVLVQLSERDRLTEAVDEDGLGTDGAPVDTGPELTWRAVDAPTDNEWSEVVWSGEWFVAADVAGGTDVFRSTDGERWEPLTDRLPFTLEPHRLVSSGGTLLLLWTPPGSWDLNTGSPLTPIGVLVSDDHGETWRDAGSIDIAAMDTTIDQPDPDDYSQIVPWVSSVAASDDGVVAAVTASLSPDFTRALLDQGLIEPGDRPQILEADIDGESGRVEGRFCPAEIEHSGDDEHLCPDGGVAFSFTAEAAARQWTSLPDTTFIVVSDGSGGFAVASEIDGHVEGIEVTGDRFVATGWGDQGEVLLYSSPDGVSWESEAFDDGSFYSLTSDGERVVMVSAGGGDYRYQISTDGARTWSSQPLPIDGIDPTVGPGGYAVLGYLPPGDDGLAVELLNWLSGRPSDPGEQVIGWSSDGTTWGWQPVQDALGTTSWAELTVGDDTVLALAYPDYEADYDGHGSAQYFVADIPQED